ncbi:MAG TPA: Minf_1886 family protein [Pirellulales bacterium]|jgi:uncharacterized repeat protein (TIGR04138 family)|nr:Minf_1886 family protein [Pirellulales bacterium]
MLDPSHPLAKLLKQDRRYKLDAYAFVEEALSFAHNSLGMGIERESDEPEPPAPRVRRSAERAPERHLTGQELCEAIRQYALDEYGYMAKSVLESWGIKTTRDFGNIVFNLIDIERMKKTKQDRREDFDDVFDFDIAFRQDFKITPAEKRSG